MNLSSSNLLANQIKSIIKSKPTSWDATQIQSRNITVVLFKFALVRMLMFPDLDSDVFTLKKKVTHTVWFHLCKMSRTGKFVETESQLGEWLPGLGGGGVGSGGLREGRGSWGAVRRQEEWLLMGISLEIDGNDLELYSGYTTY